MDQMVALCDAPPAGAVDGELKGEWTICRVARKKQLQMNGYVGLLDV